MLGWTFWVGSAQRETRDGGVGSIDGCTMDVVGHGRIDRIEDHVGGTEIDEGPHHYLRQFVMKRIVW